MADKKLVAFRLEEKQMDFLRKIDPTGDKNATNGLRYLIEQEKKKQKQEGAKR